MLTHLLSAFAALLLLLAGWIAIQTVARRFAHKHPECGAYQEVGGDCGGGCSGCGQTCSGEPSHPDDTRSPHSPGQHD